MTRQPVTWFITRHPGARQWAQRHGIKVTHWLAHMDGAAIVPGDIVMGTLPVNLAAEVCQLGAHYLHLCLQLPADARGRELTADELDIYGATLTPYQVEPVDRLKGWGDE